MEAVIEATLTRTTCPYCGVGCGVKVTTGLPAGQADSGPRGLSLTIAGDTEHPANYGKLCGKGQDLPNTLQTGDRLLNPSINGKSVPWSKALSHIAEQFQSIIDEYGRESIAFYVSGQILTEDYYVANKFVKGYLGTANIDTNSRLCMASTVAGHKRAFGSDAVPGCYEDIDTAEVILLVGSNMAWCHPVLYQRIRAAKEKRPSLQLIVIDPRQTASLEIADTHLALNADTDIDLFNGLLNHIASGNHLNKRYIENHTEHFDKALTAASMSIDEVSRSTGIAVQSLADFYQLFSQTEKVITVFSQGVNQSARGADTVNSIINCHLATGRIGKPGMGPFSVTGQPNAMGGREVGGLANMLAAHMDIDNQEHQKLVQTFWNSPRIATQPGQKAVDLFKAIKNGNIKAVWIMATNPVDSMPQANQVAAALAECPLVIVSDVVKQSDTQSFAHVRLPALAWGEKDGTVTNSERRISRQRAFLKPCGNSKPDWWAICEVAKRLGYESSFTYHSAAEIFREHAALSAFKNNGQRDFDIGAVARLSDADYQTMTPFQWPHRGQHPVASKRLFTDGKFFTQSGRAQFIPIPAITPTEHSARFPLILNTGRIRDQWHTMTRTGTSTKLSSHLAEPYIEIHPVDASHYGIADADIVQMSSNDEHVLLRALITHRCQLGTVFSPMHWTNQFSSLARINTLVSSTVDPVSGQPASKSQRVSIKKAHMNHYGFAVFHEQMQETIQPYIHNTSTYWAIAKCESGWRVEFSGTSTPQQIARGLQNLLNQHLSKTTQIEPVTSVDCSKQIYRFAYFDKSTLLAVFYISPQPVPLERHWASTLLTERYSAADRSRILSATPAASESSVGAIICTCFMVGSHQIRQASIDHDNCSVNKIGQLLQAGTNCGSCRSEIASLLRQTGPGSEGIELESHMQGVKLPTKSLEKSHQASVRKTYVNP